MPMEIDNELFQYILENSINGVIVIGEDLLIKYSNQMACEILEMDKSSLTGKHIENFGVLDSIERILETGERQISQKIHYKDKKVLVDMLPIIRNDGISGVILIFQSVSKYENIVEELKNFKDLNIKLRAIIDSSYDGIYVTDGEANTILINKAYERITGLGPEDIVGKNMQELVDKGYFSQSGSLLAMSKGTMVTIRQRLHSGKEILVTSTPVHDSRGKRIYIVTNVRDISDLVKLQNELSETKKMNEMYRFEIETIRGKLSYSPEFVMKDKNMRNLVETVCRVAKVDTTVLLQGETGVGKGVVAKFIHKESFREGGKFIEVNCGAIPHNLIESELFGYDRGAFTGASKSGKSGYFELAHKGTLFLDEISELALDMQVKLLKVLQDKTVFRVGGQGTTNVDVRIIAATNKDLKELVNKGLFREDLYYRLNVVPITVPPLRERRDDIIPLSLSFLEEFNKKYNMNKYISTKCLDQLIEYAWPGNIRELKNLIERMIVTTLGDEIDTSSLPRYLLSVESFTACCSEEYMGLSLKEARERFELNLIEETVKKYGSLRRAARALGVDPSTITRKRRE
jgi:PAS domain S-box-containing protein